MPSNNLNFFAGPSALERIRSGGLNPEDVQVVAGAAGGPKWLVLSHLDRTIFTTWFKHRKRPLFLIGSSSGAWRFAMVAQSDPVAAVDRFESAYIHQYYSSNPPPEEIQQGVRRIIDNIMPLKGPNQILSHPFLRLNMMAVRCKGPVAMKAKPLQMAGMIAAIGLNMIHRRGLRFLFNRALFYDPRDTPPFFNMDDFPILKIPLTQRNLKSAMMSSGAIPLIMPGVKDIQGAPRGTYRDGGVIDYHMALPYAPDNGIILLPHYTNCIIPGWLDKSLSWRRPTAKSIDNMLMFCPSDSFLARLPYGKIPDRDDFKFFQGRDKERVAYWQKAADTGRLLADEFMQIVSSNRIRQRVRPMP